MQVVSQLELQLAKERDRLQAMMQHLHMNKQQNMAHSPMSGGRGEGDVRPGGGDNERRMMRPESPKNPLAPGVNEHVSGLNQVIRNYKSLTCPTLSSILSAPQSFVLVLRIPQIVMGCRCPQTVVILCVEVHQIVTVLLVLQGEMVLWAKCQSTQICCSLDSHLLDWFLQRQPVQLRPRLEVDLPEFCSPQHQT